METNLTKKIPTNATRVFSGILFDVYQWEQKMYDGSTATFEMLDRMNSAQVLAIKDGKILITKERQPGRDWYIGLLGGRLEKGEDPLEGAKRELKEESGLESDHWELFKIYNPYSKMDWDMHLFIAKECVHVGGHEHDPGEDLTVLELTFDEFIEEMCKEDFYGSMLARDILRMRLNGTLDAFKKKLLD